jgi:Glycosyltransferase family 87
VAQYLSLFARVPSPLMLIALAIAAVAGFLAVTVLLWREIGGRGSTADGPVLAVAVLPVLAVAPFVAPFAVALVFGNLDALFGALVPTLAARFAGGAGLAVAGVAKVYPAAMGLWFVVRGLRDRRRGEAAPGGWIVIGSAAAIMLAVVAASVIVGGFSPWSDYVSVLRAGADASFIDSRNIGPAPQLALLTGAGEATARTLAVIVAAVALIVTAGAAWLRDDTLESFGWAAVASLVVLPVTWFHYPVALMPVALVAWMRANAGVRRDVNGLLLAAIGIGVVAVAVPVAGWASVALVLAAVHRGIPATVAADPLAALQRSRVSRDPIPESRG